jgi:hypothetical protein
MAWRAVARPSFCQNFPSCFSSDSVLQEFCDSSEAVNS